MEFDLPTKQDFDRLEQKLDRILNATGSNASDPVPLQNEGSIDFAIEILSAKAAISSKPTIYKWSHEGRIPCTKRGKKLWFNRQDLESWIESGMPHIGQKKAANQLAKTA